MLLLDLFIGKLVPWLLGLGIPALIRYKVLKKPIQKLWKAILLSLLLGFMSMTILILIDTALYYNRISYSVTGFIALVSIFILKAERPSSESLKKEK